MDILSKANSIVSEYDKIIKQMMDNDIILNQEKMTLLSREKSALDDSYQLCKQYIDLNNQLSELDEMKNDKEYDCLLYTSPSPRDWMVSRMPSSA